MKIAFFSDVHSNLPALEAVLADIDQQQPDFIFCLGDLVGYNIWPNEVIAIIRKRMIPTIAGNYDEGIGNSSDDCGCAYRTNEEKANGAISISFTNEIITEPSRVFLRNLPRQITLKFENNNKSISLLMVHGSPRKINEYLFEDRPEKSLMRIFEDAHADIMLFGHTHKPYHRILNYDQEGETAYGHAINTGSVGKPKDGNPKAGYVIMTLNEDLSVNEKDVIKVDFRRVQYDVDLATKAIEESRLPDIYAEALRKAF